jgi:hypothetical protein
MNVTFLTAPALGGVFSVFRSLREEFALLGAEARWLAAGPGAAAAAEAFPGELACGSVVVAADDSPAAQTAALLREIDGLCPDVLVCNVLSSPVEQNLLFYLPPAVARVIVVHNISPMTYRAARALRDRVDAAICVNPKIRRDLVAHHGFEPHRAVTIPNGVARAVLRAPAPRPEGAFRVLYLGRIEEQAKGVGWLAPIFARLRRDIPGATLTVAGGGPDLTQLRRSMARAGLLRAVTFLGNVPSGQVPGLVAAHDALVLPSRFEGCPLTLIESMAAGCVPVASRIAGATDSIVTHEEDGFLFSVGDAHAAAAHLSRLARDGELQSRLRRNAVSTVQRRFLSSMQAQGYLALFRTQPAASARPRPRPMTEWRIDPGLLPGWWHCLPAPIKNGLRLLRARAPRFAEGVLG